MAVRNENVDDSKLAMGLRHLHREVELLRRALERSEERADSLLQNLIALEQAVPSGCVEPQREPATVPLPPVGPTESTFLLETIAKNGVDKLEIEWLPDGAALVRIDGGKALRLAPTLAGLLETLACDPARDDERLVGWKSREEVRVALQKRMGRKFTRHAIEGLLCRLRAALAANGVNPFLVQKHRQFGLRFALRRPAIVTGREPL